MSSLIYDPTIINNGIVNDSYSSNINEISLISVYWSDTLNKSTFSNISIFGNYYDLIDVPVFLLLHLQEIIIIFLINLLLILAVIFII